MKKYHFRDGFSVMHFSKFLNKFLSVAIILHGEAKQRNSRHEITRHVN